MKQGGRGTASLRRMAGLLGALAVAAASPAVAQESPAAAPRASEPSTLQIPAFAYPASSLSSAALKAAYARSLATPGDGTIPIPKDPKMVAPMRTIVNSMFEKTLPRARELYAVEITPDTIAGVEVIRVRPKAGIERRNRNRVLLSLHGGSFMVGWPSTALLDSIPVAALSGIEVVTINYRKYPEAVHPAALEDVAAVYREVLKTRKPGNVGIYGGSAGGVATLQAIPWFKQHGLPVPGAIGAFSAAFQTGIGDSAIWNFSGGFTAPGKRLVSAGGYLGAHDRRDWVPGTSPEALASYPPVLWVAGTRAPEVSGVVTAHAAMLKRGVPSELYLIEGGWHQSYSTAPETPESQDAMRYIARFFDTRLGK
jgi:epsilon-lactone hydrolase